MSRRPQNYVCTGIDNAKQFLGGEQPHHPSFLSLSVSRLPALSCFRLTLGSADMKAVLTVVNLKPNYFKTQHSSSPFLLT